MFFFFFPSVEFVFWVSAAAVTQNTRVTAATKPRRRDREQIVRALVINFPVPPTSFVDPNPRSPRGSCFVKKKTQKIKRFAYRCRYIPSTRTNTNEECIHYYYYFFFFFCCSFA